MFLKLDNNNQEVSFDLNNLDNLNLSESIMNDLRELKNSNNNNIEVQKTEDKNKEPENNNNQKPDLTLGSSTFAKNRHGR